MIQSDHEYKKYLIINLRPGSDNRHSENISIESNYSVKRSESIRSAEEDNNHGYKLKLSTEEKVVLHVVKIS